MTAPRLLSTGGAENRRRSDEWPKNQPEAHRVTSGNVRSEQAVDT
jgi:hypothetical protein